MVNKNRLKRLTLFGIALGNMYTLLKYIAKHGAEEDNIDEDNPYLVDGVLTEMQETTYEKYIKPALDKIASFVGLIIISPLYVLISAAIYIDDPGPIFFMQKRIGKNKNFFYLHKFRTMKIAAPHDVPTHQLENPEQYITRIGKILRKYSLDELPQVWDIFRGKMSIIGPRPALWNQKDLVEARDKYLANSVMPGLTGWAQINGRDELKISDKAKFDGEYVRKLKQGGFAALFFDVKCFLGTILNVISSDGVIEGSTGKSYQDNVKSKEVKKSILVVCQYYYPENFQITPICEALVADGYEVTVLTGLPNYPIGIVPYEYKHGHRDEIINGVHVIRCYETGRKKGVISLAFNYFSFTIAAMKKVDKLKGTFDLVLCYQLSPILMGLPARKYSKKHGIPFLLYCCDIWPESIKIYVRNENNPLFNVARTISKKVYDSADYIIVQSMSFVEYLIQTHEIDKDDITYIPAFADETYLTADFTPEDNTVDFVFLGNLGIAQDLLTVLDAVKRIKTIPNFKVHFVGEGACFNEMKEFVRKERMEKIVYFYGRRPVEEMSKFYKLADVCMVSLKADNAIGLTLPSKVQGYMAAGKPIIAMIEGSAKEVIEESGCGICVSAGDKMALSNAMKDFIEHGEKYKDCGNRARKYFKINFAKENCMRKLENVIDCMIKQGV